MKQLIQLGRYSKFFKGRVPSFRPSRPDNFRTYTESVKLITRLQNRCF